MNLPFALKLIRQRSAFFMGFLRAKYGKKAFPLLSDLFITTRCNSRCRYCYVDKGIKSEDEMTTGQWIETIDSLIGLGCRMFNLMGGEPLLRQDFPEIMGHIVDRNILCDVNTNCYLVPEHLSTLVRASQIFTSLDGDEEAHDMNRGEGAFR